MVMVAGTAEYWVIARDKWFPQCRLLRIFAPPKELDDGTIFFSYPTPDPPKHDIVLGQGVVFKEYEIYELSFYLDDVPIFTGHSLFKSEYK